MARLAMKTKSHVVGSVGTWLVKLPEIWLLGVSCAELWFLDVFQTLEKI